MSCAAWEAPGAGIRQPELYQAQPLGPLPVAVLLNQLGAAAAWHGLHVIVAGRSRNGSHAAYSSDPVGPGAGSQRT